MALGIESHARNEDDINLLKICKRFTDGFHDMKGTLAEILRSCVTAQFHRLIIKNLRQQYDLTFSHQIVDELMSAYLIGQGIIGKDDVDIAEPFPQPYNNRKRPFTELLLSE